MWLFWPFSSSQCNGTQLSFVFRGYQFGIRKYLFCLKEGTVKEISIKLFTYKLSEELIFIP